jgi:hypothetical protein
MHELGELHIRELLERAGETGLMRDQFSRTVPAADTPQDGVVLQALDQVASGGEIVNGFSYRGNWRNGPAFDSDSRNAAAAPFRACRARMEWPSG